MSRWWYSLLWYFITPLICAYLCYRARKQPAYLQHWSERFMWKTPQIPPGAIWIHAVSVGETRAAAPLIRALRAAYPEAPLLLTQMTPTGRETAQELFGDAAYYHYLPYDYPVAVQRFLRAVQPRFGILMETELWPNLIHAAHQQSTPLFLVNARLSERSARAYQKVAGLLHATLPKLRAIAAQTPADAQRLAALGAPSPAVLGNIKFDCAPPSAIWPLAQTLRDRIGPRLVCVAGSTREGEEALLLDALPVDFPALLLIVPRHPQRFEEIAADLARREIPFQRRSQAGGISPQTRVLLGDSMGEMFAYYALADVVFVGGSLLPFGGQNLIEPAAVGKPVVFGPHMFNFSQASEQALTAGAAVQVANAAAVFEWWQTMLADPIARQKMGQAGLDFARQHQGASARTVDFIAQHLGEQL